MVSDSSSVNWEILRIKTRMWAYTVLQLGGFLLVFYGIYAVFGPTLIEYYQRRGGVPNAVLELNAVIPELDAVSAAIVFGIGAFVVHFSTR